MCFPKTMELAWSASILTSTGVLLSTLVFNTSTASVASSVVVVWMLASLCAWPFAAISVPLMEPLSTACSTDALALCSAFIFAISSSTMGCTRGISLIVSVAVLMPRVWRRASKASGSTPRRVASERAMLRASSCVGWALSRVGTMTNAQSSVLNSFMRLCLVYRCQR